MMLRLVLLSVALGGCVATTQPAEDRLTTLKNGRNCDLGRCFRYYEGLNQIQITGREMTGIPHYVDISSGQVSSRDFLRLYHAAQGADWLDAP